jgi:phosphoesterase RecJ-like protein
MFSKEKNAEILAGIHSQSKICIVVHRNPDGDALGSSLGLKLFLKQAFGVEALVIVPDAFPDFLNWMPDANSIFIADQRPEQANQLLTEADIIFCLDFNDPSRTNQLSQVLTNSMAYKIMIDHHRNPADFCNATYSDVSVSSTSEMVLRWIEHLNLQHLLNVEIAACLYTGIMTDTGSFRFESCTATTHKMVAMLLETGLEHWNIHERISNQNSLSKLRLWGLAFKDRLVHLPEYRTAYIFLSESDLTENDYKEGDLEGLVNFALSIKNTVMGVLFSQRGGKIRISFRSVGSFPVNELSGQYFQGGGHLNAAGGVSELSPEDTINKFLNVLQAYPELKVHEN